MSVITAIFQAIFQAICYIFPISESAHSSIFHDFSGRGTNGTISDLTGIIHIGIAIGIIIASYKLFIKLLNEFIFTFPDIFKKNLKGSSKKPARNFMYLSLLSFVPMLLWLIPAGSKGFLYNLFRTTQFDNTILDDGIFLAISGALLFLAVNTLSKGKNIKNLSLVPALVVGISSVFIFPISGFSIIGVIFSILILFGVNQKQALNFGLTISVPALIVMGIIEICVSVTKVGIVSIILALVISAAVTFVSIKLLKTIIKKNYLKYFAYYDFALGAISIVVGIIELFVRG